MMFLFFDKLKSNDVSTQIMILFDIHLSLARVLLHTNHNIMSRLRKICVKDLLVNVSDE
jgi:hypothetical protein